VSALELDGISHRYSAATTLREVSLTAKEGEVVAVLGPSGAGKTTLLRVVAGLLRPAAGAVRLGGVDVTGRPPQQRNVAMMFESYALYPQLTVLENCLFALGARPGLAPREARERVEQMARLLEIEPLLGRHPSMLSGGQRQRAALCRTLVRDAAAFCLDEPIAHLDAGLRHKLRSELRRVLRARGVPALWTTPDGLEALAAADRLVVLVAGEVLDDGPPERVYGEPATTAVARLLGDPPFNLLRGGLGRRGGRLTAVVEGLALPLEDQLARRLEPGAADQVVVGLRPIDIALAREPGQGAAAEVDVFEPFGKYGIVTLRLGAQTVKVKLPGHAPFVPGEGVWVRVDPAGIQLFDGRTGRRL
jgi:multiple sugar transport system ATP-binding protein